MASTGTHVFDDFSGGEWGRIGPDKAAKNQYSATNMLVYRTGEIGVRTGVLNVSPAGLSNGTISHLEIPLGSTRAIFVQGTAVLGFEALDGSSLVTAGTALASSGTSSSPTVRRTGELFLSVIGDKTYKITSAPAVTAYSSSPAGRGLAYYGDRLVGTTGSTNVLQYSAPADPTSWPAGNILTVGDDSNINGLYSQRGHLLIAKSSGFYTLSGVPGVNDTLSEASTTPGPLTQKAGSLDGTGRLWMSPGDMLLPASFDGASEARVEYLTTQAGTVRAIRTMRDHGGGLLFSNADGVTDPAVQTMLARINSAWSIHSFPVLGSVGSRMTDYPNAVEGTDNGSFILFGTIADAGTKPAFYLWKVGQDSPGLESGTYQRAGDASTSQVSGTVELPYVTDPQGRELLVRKVTIHFRSWDTGGSLDNNITASVRALREFDGTYSDSAPLSWTQAGASSSTSGTLRRVDLNLGDQGQGSAFQIRLSALRGVAIRRIIAHYDARPAR